MKRVVIVALVAAAVAGAARGAPSSTSPLLGVIGDAPPLNLARIDPTTLRPLSGARVEAGRGGCASRDGGEACWAVPPWAFSADGKLLALARNERFMLRSLRLVDVSSLRVRADIRLPGNPIGALQWFSGGRLLAVQEVCCSGQQLLVVDVAKRRVSARRTLDGSVLEIGRTRQELVLVLAPTGAIGRPSLAVADRLGRVRTVRLAKLSAGTRLRPGPRHAVDSHLPGLAVDPLGRHAYVVGDRLIADVDLARLAVSYHGVTGPASFRALFESSLRPTAATKGGTGSFRSAAWLGGGVLAVSGAGEQTLDDETHVQPFGLRLVDTRSWRVRTIDGDATDFAVADGLLLATGWSTDSTPLGLAAYSLDGTPRFRLFEGERAWVDLTYGGRAYVGGTGAGGAQAPLRIVDLAAGKLVGTRTEPLPWLLLGRAGGWWGPA